MRFAHNSERQFAKLLDFYAIEWEYEPRTFVLERDRDGNPAQAFTPDFYLPAYDLYIEITTLNQKLVTKKNRKARRLAELYPDVQIKVLYQRDYLHLLVKYGLEPPSQLAGDGAGDAAAARPVAPARPASRGARPDAARRAESALTRCRCATARSTPSTARSARAWCRSAAGRCRSSTPACSRSTARAGSTRSCSTCRTSARCGSHGAGAFATLQWAFTNDLDRIGPGGRSTPTSSTPTTRTSSTTSSCGGSRPATSS